MIPRPGNINRIKAGLLRFGMLEFRMFSHPISSPVADGLLAEK